MIPTEGPAPRWFDHHCHLWGTPDEVAAVVDDALAAGVVGMIDVGCDVAGSIAAADRASTMSTVWATAGVHPHEARHGLDGLVEVLQRPRVVAVGECGLDYHYDHSPRPVQRDVFAAQIGLAHELGKPLVVHTREAWDDTFAMFESEGVPESTIIHCFTGGPDEAARCVDMGCFVSFSGVVSFPSAPEVRDAAALVPLGQLLVETDSPYLAPVPHRGQRNRPAWVGDVGNAVAAARSIDPGELAAATTTNAVHAYHLDPMDLAGTTP